MYLLTKLIVITSLLITILILIRFSFNCKRRRLNRKITGSWKNEDGDTLEITRKNGRSYIFLEGCSHELMHDNLLFFFRKSDHTVSLLYNRGTDNLTLFPGGTYTRLN